MKDILEIKLRGECHAPVAEVEGKYLFCGAPAPDGKTYCEECGKRMTIPGRHFVDSAEIADYLAGGKSRPPSREGSGEGSHIKPVDGYINMGRRILGSDKIDHGRSVVIKKRVVAA